jgi:trimeric autotransporter adhesin
VSGSGTQAIRLENTLGTGNVNLELKLTNGTFTTGLNNTSIYYDDTAGRVYAWYQNSAERMRLDTSGRLGIGTSAPATTLDVNGDATIYGIRVGRGAGAFDNNTVVGNSSLLANTSGQNNTAIGITALRFNTTGYQNTAVGGQALYTNTTGAFNTAYGINVLYRNESGDRNVAIGVSALVDNTTGSYNTCVGNNAGSALTTGSNNTIIGNILGTAGLADTVIIGAGSTERLRIDSSGRVGIGTSAPTQRLTVFNPTFGVPATSGTTQTNGAFRIGATGTSGVLDFGIGAAGTNQWIQSTDSNNLSLGYVLLLNPNGGNVGIGTTSPSASALLDVTSTTAGFLPPRMTTAQRDAISSPAAGLMVYNTSTNKLNFYNGTAWEAVTSA